MRFLLLGLLALASSAAWAETPVIPSNTSASIKELLRDPSPEEWKALSRFDHTLTRAEFETRLNTIFDPAHGLQPYLILTNLAATIYPDSARKGAPWVKIEFALDNRSRSPLPVDYRSSRAFTNLAPEGGTLPLQGLRIAIEPADIGGSWAKMEDRSVNFQGYGRINEGDLNLVVGKLLRDKLTRLGASVFLVREHEEPVTSLRVKDVLPEVKTVLETHPGFLPEAFRHRIQTLPKGGEPQRVAAEILLTKALETRARADRVRRAFQPDLTIVLQHNATAESTDGHLTPINRNIFFVNGAYTPSELAEPEERFRLLTKLLGDVTPIETVAAVAIAHQFQIVTGMEPVLYGNSASTRLVPGGNAYVVARNLAFNREHDGPVVVTEPYFMNQPETLLRLLAGDFVGERIIAGQPRISIFREYANCVTAGLVATYSRRIRH